MQHDNWDGGFDIYNLKFATPIKIYSKLGNDIQKIEKEILDRISPLFSTHTNDHISNLMILPKMTNDKNWREKAQNWISSKNGPDDDKKENKISIKLKPEIFSIPDKNIQEDLVSVMMPFSANYNKTFESIKVACSSVGFRCLRADDLWNHSTIIQDIFELIYTSKIVVVDFSEKNPNVFYETGIAHTLGKRVIPITQDIENVPFDLRHHRIYKYLPNNEGYDTLIKDLKIILSALTGRKPH